MSRPVPAPLGTIGRYTLLERLDPSGPGDLFRARDTHRGRTVAVRLLPESFTPEPAAREALVAEARTLIPLSHPNITALFDAGDHGTRAWVAFEFLRGQSLRAEMAGRIMNPRRVVEIAVQIADAVAEAHAQGFVHGGLSPDSVMITTRGHAKIPTFHLASQVGFDESRREGALHDYDSPEEAKGEKPDDRSDIYSIGAVIFEMLTGRRPMHRGAAAPSATNPSVPKRLDRLVLKAISPNPLSRPATAAALAAELRAIAALLDAGEAAEGADMPGDSRRSRRLLVAAGVLVVLLLVALAWWLTRP